jgi:hypothetical protein
MYECDCCGRPNVPQKLKGIGYVCEDCLTSYTWDYGRLPPEQEPLSHWPACPFKVTEPLDKA